MFRAQLAFEGPDRAVVSKEWTCASHTIVKYQSKALALTRLPTGEAVEFLLATGWAKGYDNLRVHPDDLPALVAEARAKEIKVKPARRKLKRIAGETPACRKFREKMDKKYPKIPGIE